MKLKKYKSLSKNLFTYALIIIAFVIVQLLIASGNISSALKGQIVPIAAYIVMAVSLNLTVGILGELSLGHAGFMSVGAFVGVIISTRLENVIISEPIRLAVSMIAGGLFAAVVGVIVGVPALRLRGDYLAIVTLAFGEIIKNLINIMYVGTDRNGLSFSMKNAESLNLEEGGKVILNGPMGAVDINKISTISAGFILIIITLFVVLNLINSRSGRAIMAIRDNRIAAESVGISITRYKLMAFVISATLAGLAGTLFALNFSTVVAKNFDFNTSILILVFVVLGGIGNIRGSIIAATILTVLPEMLRQFKDYRMLLYAIILIVVMIVTNNEKTKFVLNELVFFAGKKTRTKDKRGGATHE